MDFKFIENKISGTYIVSAVKRAKRPDVSRGIEPVCPFCIGNEGKEREVFRIGGKEGDSNWQVRVIPNKFPFAPIHEVVIHSPDHHKNFDTLPTFHTELILKTYWQRYQTHKDKGWVYIFHNHGKEGGESLPHPHSQIAVIPEEVIMNIQRLEAPSEEEEVQKTNNFVIFCPLYSQWPEEVWIYPKKRGRTFGEIEEEEITDLSKILYRVIQIMDLRHGNEFPFNFYIYPGGDWYLRIIPRFKTLGGFELGTGIFVNTQDPRETIRFIKTHFVSPDEELIRTKDRARYRRGV
jgi:UDPglucose--hexose-1-phosphate uridylyltransferase